MQRVGCAVAVVWWQTEAVFIGGGGMKEDGSRCGVRAQSTKSNGADVRANCGNCYGSLVRN